MTHSRRDFLKTAGLASLATLAPSAPRVILADDIDRKQIRGEGRRGHRALDGRRDGPRGDVRPQAAYARSRPGMKAGRRLQHVPLGADGRRWRPVQRGAGTDRPGDGPGNLDPLARRGRPRRDPPFAPPVPLAHRVRAAGQRRGAAPRGLDRPCARAQEPGGAGLHRHRPADRRQRRGRGTPVVPDRRRARLRVRPVPHPRPLRRRRRRPPARRHDPLAVPEPLSRATRSSSRPARSAAKAPTISASPSSARWRTPTGCSTPTPRKRSTSPWSRSRITTSTTPAGSAWAACWPAGWSRREPGTSR